MSNDTAPSRTFYTRDVIASPGEQVFPRWVASRRWRPISGHVVTALPENAVDGIIDVTLVLAWREERLRVPWCIVLDMG